MALLLDTHTLLWYAQDDAQLPDRTAQLIRTAPTPCVLSSVSLWEISIKVAVGKLSLVNGFEGLLGLVEQYDFRRLDITDAHLTTYLQLPLFADHRDPFDRLLVAQARAEGLEIVSRDPNLARYGATVRW